MIGAAGLIGRAVLIEARRAGTANAVVARSSTAVPDAQVLRLSAAAVDPLARLIERLEPIAIVNASGRTAGNADELWQANVEPGSLAENVNVAVALLSRTGGLDSIDVSGVLVSIVQVKVAGVGSVLPAGSVARTEKVWEPSARPL